MSYTSKTTSEYNNLSCSAITTVTTNDVFTLVVQNNSGTGNLTVSYLNFVGI